MTNTSPATEESSPTTAQADAGATVFDSLGKVQAQAATMRRYFETGATLDPKFRGEQLKNMKKWLKSHEKDVLYAVYQDLGKAAYETYITELGLVYEEIDCCIKNVHSWSAPQHVSTPITMFPSSSVIYPYPYGVTLVLSPWNYPIQLALIPMVDAIAAGNCVAFKPARESAHTSAILIRMAQEVFDPQYVCGIPGSAHMNDWIMQTQWDYIMFTGSPKVGKIIMSAAANFLTPVTLELGGKSPCIVHDDADIKIAAERIAWGKGLNCGQTCVAPDYLLVQEDVADELVRGIADEWTKFYGDNALDSDIWPHMISEKHYNRVMGLIDNHNPNAKIVCGGTGDPATWKIQPTIMTGVTLDDPVMGEEIFGPVLPVFTYKTLDEAFDFVKHFEHPLACYIFSESKKVQQQVIYTLQFGGMSINDCCVHLTNDKMGFGGVGNSGMGAYHGKVGFDTFTHYKSTMAHSTKIDTDVRFPPFTADKKKLARKLMG
ncbi:aldehyde dehydrogenase [Bifidobacterium choloepi]|uniref:Aldehyde dehydrogenase n=1 Tax=Bifidobacterium choloepi TaxID=2614131 RepID=A0A6I5N108_9BIFI|nr:aldehyde dehydrogenase [Bifidobacterium choloepi]NEG70628.1 aldehyde dehydrogenase [Bifidobacterium choloepi]